MNCNCPPKENFPNACERPCPCDCHKGGQK